MPQRRNIFIHGLGITLRRFPAMLWTYIFNLGLALIFSAHLYSQFSDVISHSLAAQRLIGGFDLGTAVESVMHITDAPASGAAIGFSGIYLYLLLYFLLVPGTLFCYLTKTPAHLSTLLHQGLLHFWRFVRITILTFFISALILGPLFVIQGAWSTQIDNNFVGRTSFLLRITGLVFIFLVATLLRLYFDLVEVYTVQLGLQIRSNGKPDRRVRRALGPAWRTFREHFSQSWPIFLFLTILGAAAVIITARISMHMLAQPRVWPMFLLAQLGLFLMLFTRFWQRGVEVSLASQDTIASRSLPGILPISGIVDPTDPLHPKHHPISDRISAIYNPAPIPGPEPSTPSLDEPDPGVFHHDPIKPMD
jgi:hypothetical protein